MRYEALLTILYFCVKTEQMTGGTHALETAQHSVKNPLSSWHDTQHPTLLEQFQETGDTKPSGNGQIPETSRVIKMFSTEAKLVWEELLLDKYTVI